MTVTDRVGRKVKMSPLELLSLGAQTPCPLSRMAHTGH